jgi:manganese/zinc/iron transport system substrate-binding protein
MILAVLVSVLVGCGKQERAASGVKVTATIGMIADVAREVGGERAIVTGLMGEGVDPHLYKASPGDVRLMTDADVLLYNGLHLEGRMADAIIKLAGRVKVVQVTEAIEESRLRQPAEFEGHFDPHVWFDVELWGATVLRIRDALTQVDPDGREAYAKRAEEYGDVLRELDAYVTSTIATIPETNRVMVTAHDAFGYFADAYDIEVLAIQGISTDSEASLQDINALVQTLVERKVPAVFIESSVPRKTVDALVEGCKAKGHAIVIGGELFSDAPGKAGTREGTYVGMVLHNVETITKALGGSIPAQRPAKLHAYLLARFGTKAGGA